MKDEIKEFIEFRTDEDGTYFYYNDKDNIEQWSYKLDELKDYIINLQEELKSANESISWWQNRFNAVSNGNKDLKSRNEKATEYMNNYIEVEDAPINERIKTEFKEVIRLLTGGDK